MTVKITIIGLGQIGASIGLALANHKDQVTTRGYDNSPEVTRKAQKMAAVENVEHNLSASVKWADVVLLALPLDQVYETLKSIAQDVREEGLVIDTAPVKQAVASWAEEFLPPRRHYVGLTPAINPLLLDEISSGIEAARADLFQNGLVAVTAPPRTAGEAIKLAASFVTLLGARAFFADLAEVDGIMAVVHTLPALAAAALTETIIEQRGWSDIRKLAGRPFVTATRLLDSEESTALVEAARQNRVNTVRTLDDYIATLKSLRDEIDEEEKKNLQIRLERILKGRAQWRRARADGDWQSIESLEQEIPSFSELWMQQLGLGKLLGLGYKKVKKD
ncbi:MAG: prephenate dehydrogenase/arogenate dehydrogenase family protein [Anaerolineales bacterium]|jgi:prephenate dehydrogenase